MARRGKKKREKDRKVTMRATARTTMEKNKRQRVCAEERRGRGRGGEEKARVENRETTRLERDTHTHSQIQEEMLEGGVGSGYTRAERHKHVVKHSATSHTTTDMHSVHTQNEVLAPSAPLFFF